jgi:hypothetical protein
MSRPLGTARTGECHSLMRAIPAMINPAKEALATAAHARPCIVNQPAHPLAAPDRASAFYHMCSRFELRTMS